MALLSLAVGVATLLHRFKKPNIYQATAVITPSVDQKTQNTALVALASLGVTIGGPSSTEDLEQGDRFTEATGSEITVQGPLYLPPSWVSPWG